MIINLSSKKSSIRNWAWAVQQMEAGYRVRHTDWNKYAPETYIFMDNGIFKYRRLQQTDVLDQWYRSAYSKMINWEIFEPK